MKLYGILVFSDLEFGCFEQNKNVYLFSNLWVGFALFWIICGVLKCWASVVFTASFSKVRTFFLVFLAVVLCVRDFVLFSFVKPEFLCECLCWNPAIKWHGSIIFYMPECHAYVSLYRFIVSPGIPLNNLVLFLKRCFYYDLSM